MVADRSRSFNGFDSTTSTHPRRTRNRPVHDDRGPARLKPSPRDSLTARMTRRGVCESRAVGTTACLRRILAPLAPTTTTRRPLLAGYHTPRRGRRYYVRIRFRLHPNAS